MFDPDSDFEIIIESESESESDFEIVIDSDSDDEQEDNFIKVLSIDVGIKNLGMSVSILNTDYTLKEIVYIELLDITTFLHRCNPRECKLYHKKSISDWMEHLFEYHKMFFEQCDVILVENQPITGIKSVEQLIFNRYRNKVQLISPNRMHKLFHINHLDYDARKVQTEKIARKYLCETLTEELDRLYDRKHDITDSICIMLVWMNDKRTTYIQDIKRERILNNVLVYKNSILTLNQWFEQFRYISY